MGTRSKKELKDAMHSAELSDIDLDSVAGGTCNESCYSSCSACCKDGSANRAADYEVLHQTP